MPTNIFTKPVLASCTNRNYKPTENPFFGSIEEFFVKGIQELGLRSVSFDFFVDWNSDQLNRNLWFKAPVNKNISIESLEEDRIKEALRKSSFGNLSKFAKNCNLSLSAVIYDDEKPFNEQMSVYQVLWPANNLGYGLKYKKTNIKNIMDEIRTKSGGPQQIGAKGLMYGTSRMECYLSYTDALWPGDADLVLLNSKFFPIAVIEFKKHTNNSKKINFKNQKLSNYYPNPDKRKYNRLKILSQQLTNIELPLFNIYYSTETQNQSKIIVENIDGQIDSLITGKTKSFEITNNGSKDIISYILSESNQ